MLTIHHLKTSQSERIIWLCEELGILYDLKIYERDKVTLLGPPALRAVHPLGLAPAIVDDGVVLAESGAIIDYLLARNGGSTLAPGSGHPAHTDYLFWYHFANSTLQAVLGRNMILGRLGLPADNPVLQSTRGRMQQMLGLVEARLGPAAYLAGDALTAADIMIVFSLTTMRKFIPFSLDPYPNIRAYLQRIGARPAYQRAMRKGDPALTPMLT